jgi:hypothetical protein
MIRHRLLIDAAMPRLLTPPDAAVCQRSGAPRAAILAPQRCEMPCHDAG